jgi:predicted membrane channel-forming protein YqfA (hemolysin III family)
MNKFTVGLVLLIIGVVLLLVGGISYTTRERTKIGPIAIEHPEEHRIPYSPLAGGLLTLTGGALMLVGRAAKNS